ncbi:MAG: RNA methyltransferase [Gammaproteobacteria bacterium]|nr:RNA methyltransferase [Gammaproteobacteria bacterium]MCP5137403.1 RNA methyltransferase [Gammaproteobacteria bacterium]
MTQRCVKIGLVNPKSPTNVGAIMRAAGCFAADAVYFSGGRFERAEKFQTDTKNARQRIALNKTDDFLDAAKDARLVCVELVLGAVALPDFVHPDQAFYLFGPEDGTLPQAYIDAADSVVYIPTIGCLNLAASVNVVLYDREVKLRTLATGDALIRRSRDVNNRTRIA